MARAHILIIDDEVNIREAIQMALEPDGYSVETAADGPSGLERFADGSDWDLVLLDQRMPGLEGVDVLQRIRERAPGARVVMITAYGSIELAVEAMKRGATDFLRKPFDPEVLRGAVKVALEQHQHEPTVPTQAGKWLLDQPFSIFLNGYRFWEVPPSRTVSPDAVAHTFSIQPPWGQAGICTVEFTAAARREAEAEAGRPLPPSDDVWEPLTAAALADFLLAEARLPPGTLTVLGLNDEARTRVHRLARPPAEVPWEGF